MQYISSEFLFLPCSILGLARYAVRAKRGARSRPGYRDNTVGTVFRHTNTYAANKKKRNENMHDTPVHHVTLGIE
ncbi:hypothetical protein F4803DRAFT_531083 [Xylaria telfairii]|nr:hypothetical protein F4803DRAFT_531083 [Xylaria telfairii]